MENNSRFERGLSSFTNKAIAVGVAGCAVAFAYYGVKVAAGVVASVRDRINAAKAAADEAKAAASNNDGGENDE